MRTIEAHWLIYERWDTVEHDEAYRSFRAGEGRLTELPPLLAAPPVKTRYRTTGGWRPRTGSLADRDGQRGRNLRREPPLDKITSSAPAS
jgi:hypothetical protein